MGFLKSLFGKKDKVAAKPKLLFANRRWGVVTAYFQETLESLTSEMVAPRNGIMVFTDDTNVPRTGNQSEIELLAQETGRELRWVSEYSFYTICRGMVSPQDDIQSYSHLVCPSLSAALSMSKNPPL